MNILEEYMQRRYTAIVKLDEATDGTFTYLAYHPDLDGCMSHGDTAEEALANLENARRLYIETMLEQGIELPVPTGLHFTQASAGSATTVQGRLVTTTLPVHTDPDASAVLPVSLQFSNVPR